MPQRDLSIDLIKIIAMFSVIGLHTFLLNTEWAFSNVFYETSAIGVPLFFTVSGYLILGRKSLSSRYVIRKVFGILRLVFIIAVLYWIFESVYTREANWLLLPKLYIEAFVQRGSLWHCWYLGSMIVVYMLAPLINYLYLHQRKTFYVLFGAFFVFDYFVFLENIKDGEFEIRMIQTFRLWNWLFYFMLGGVVKALDLRSNKKNTPPRLKDLYLLIAVFFVLNVFFQERYKSIISHPHAEFYYCSMILMGLVASVFICVRGLSFSSSKVITEMSRLFLPVYLAHPYISSLLEESGLYLPLPMVLYPYVRFLVVSVCTVVFSFLLMRIPKMDRIIRI